MLDKDILNDFQGEARGLLEELAEVVEKLEEKTDTFPADLLGQFAQRIDRIMGAAETLTMLDEGNPGLTRIGGIARLCKTLGYKAVNAKATTLVPLFAAFWADTIDVLTELVDTLGEDEKNQQIAKSFGEVLQKRLAWLEEKLQQLDPNAKSTMPSDQDEVNAILASLNV